MFAHLFQSGRLVESGIALSEVADIANALELRSLLSILDVEENRQFAGTKRFAIIASIAREQMGISCLQDRFNCDVIIQLDDGRVRAHRALLAARSDMMDAMFCGDYRESSTREVRLRKHMTLVVTFYAFSFWTCFSHIVFLGLTGEISWRFAANFRTATPLCVHRYDSIMCQQFDMF